MVLGWWFEARVLSALQGYLDQPLPKPLPHFERQLLGMMAKLTRMNGGTPLDAASRFYSAYADRALDGGSSLDDVGFAGVAGRIFASRGKMNFYPEHHAALLKLREKECVRRPGVSLHAA
jgi:hypothetical protein